MSTGTDQSMITLFRDEMAANRLETKEQINLLQQQFSTLQNIITGLIPHLDTTKFKSDSSGTNNVASHDPIIIPDQQYQTQPDDK
jgi:hypothetical protein